MEIIGYIIVAAFAIGISPFLKGFVNKFVEEDRLEEENEKKNENIIKRNAKKNIGKKENDGKRKDGKNIAKKQKDEKATKVKLTPEFDWKVTLITVILEIILYIQFGFTFEFMIYAFLTTLLIVCMFSDIAGCIIPNEVNFIGFIVGIVLTFVKMTYDVKLALDALGGMIIGILIFLAIAGLSLLMYKREGMGGGDIKLMGMIGLYLGIMNNVQVFILSFFLAAIISIVLLATKRKKSDDYIPFGPFIVMAAYITMLFPASVTMPAIMQLLN